jgi:hypothetical protein
MYRNRYAYKYFYNQTTHVNKAWTNIVLVQNYLTNNNIKYLMSNSYSLTGLIQYHDDSMFDFNYNIYNKINLDKFVDDADNSGFINLVKEQGFVFFNPHHPNTDGHMWYLEKYIIPKLADAYYLF